MLFSGLLQERHCFGSFSLLCMCAGQAAAGESDQNRLLLRAQPLLGQHEHRVLLVPLHAATSCIPQAAHGFTRCSRGGGSAPWALGSSVLSRKEGLFTGNRCRVKKNWTPGE